MGLDASLRGPVVVGGDDQYGVSARLRCGFGQRYRVSRASGARAGDHGNADGLAHRAPQLSPFRVAEGRSFTGRPRQDEPVVPVVGQPLRQLDCTRHVQPPAVVEGRRHRADDCAKAPRCRHHEVLDVGIVGKPSEHRQAMQTRGQTTAAMALTVRIPRKGSRSDLRQAIRFRSPTRHQGRA